MEFTPGQPSATPPVSLKNEAVLAGPTSKNVDTRHLTDDEKDKFLLEHMYIVQKIVNRVTRTIPSLVEKKDLAQEGFLGLLEAMETYDPSKGVPFSAFALFRIRGHIIDYLRDEDFLPRSVRKNMKGIQALLNKNENRRTDGLAPLTDEEMARSLEIPLETYRQCLGLLQADYISSPLDALNDQDHAILIDNKLESSDKIIQRKELSRLTRAAIEEYFLSLPLSELTRSKDVYIKYFLEGKTNVEIAKDYNLTPSRISQLITKIKQGVKAILISKGVKPEDVGWE